MMLKGNKDVVVILTTCPMCGKAYELTVPTDGYFAWRVEGALVQDAFPEMSASDREMLISGICEECQEDIFGDDFEESDDWPDWDDDYDYDFGYDPYLGYNTYDC